MKMSATLGRNFRRRSAIFSLLVGLVCMCLHLDAQEVNVSDAYINIPEGAFVGTDGSIVIEDAGAIDNDGTLALKGNWTNNGKGLLETSEGKVVLNGKDQMSMEGNGTKELQANITVIQQLKMENCALLTHDFHVEWERCTFDDALWLNTLIISEKVSMDAGTTMVTSGIPSNLALQGLGIIPAAAPVAPTSPKRQKSSSNGKTTWGLSTHIRATTFKNLSSSGKIAPSKGFDCNGASAALATMYFSSGKSGNNDGIASLLGNQKSRCYTSEGTDYKTVISTQRVSWNSISASAFFLFAQNRIDIIRA
jgi:hypothetical protein